MNWSSICTPLAREELAGLKINGWDFCPVDIMDEDGAVMIPVKGGRL